MTGASIHLLTKCLLCPLSTSTPSRLPFLQQLALSLVSYVKHPPAELLFFSSFFVLHRLLTEPRGRLRGCLGALGLKEKAAVSELPLVP